MPDNEEQPDNAAYFYAWVGWYFLWTAPAILIGIALVVINFFARVVPVTVAYYGFIGIEVTLMLTLIGIAGVGLYRRSRGWPAWEPWPLRLFAVKLYGVAKHIG
ncbi:hypothetical protein OT109_02990 [Phycisphaeraceae bacterium D3-23]